MRRLKSISRGAWQAARIAPAALAGLLLAGCLDAPGIEQTWTRLDITGSSLSPNQAVLGGAPLDVSLGTDITYRRIVTGFAVAELRASGSIGAASVAVAPDGPRLAMAQDIDRILAGSVSLGRMTRAVTGWDHLIQHVDFTFTGVAPAAGDSLANGLFLVCYLGSGQRVRQAGGADSIVITPFVSQPAQILPVGMKLSVTAAGTP